MPDQDAQETKAIRIFDTTLRDGEQSPGASLNGQEKLEIARQLEALGVDVIEAGFPITSQGDFEAVRAIGQELGRATVCGLARCVPRDIDRAGEAVKGAAHPRIHTFVSSSSIHLEHQMRKSTQQVLDLTRRCVEQARGHTDDVEFSAMDASRTDPGYLAELVAVAVEAGATTINLPDTVGYATPDEHAAMFRGVAERVPAIGERGVVLSCHCHDDLGLAVANSLAAVLAGARQVECTINGIGERAGNTSLEEIVMAIRTRRDVFAGVRTGIDTRKIFPTSRMVATLTGVHVQRNKAIVGENAFAHESGIHQDGMLKHRSTYEIMDPRDIGVPESKLVLGKHSGRHALRDRVAELGYHLDDAALDRVYDRFKALADKKKDVYDEDIEAILDQELTAGVALWELARFQVTSGTDAIATATVVLRDSSGETQMDAATGDGPIDAVYSAIQRITGVNAALEDYSTRAVTQGRDAQGEVSVRIRHRGGMVRGRGLSTDVIEAAAQAYLSAINRIRTMEQRGVSATSIGADDEASQPAPEVAQP